MYERIEKRARGPGINGILAALTVAGLVVAAPASANNSVIFCPPGAVPSAPSGGGSAIPAGTPNIANSPWVQWVSHRPEAGPGPNVSPAWGTYFWGGWGGWGSNWQSSTCCGSYDYNRPIATTTGPSIGAGSIGQFGGSGTNTNNLNYTSTTTNNTTNNTTNTTTTNNNNNYNITNNKVINSNNNNSQNYNIAIYAVNANPLTSTAGTTQLSLIVSPANAPPLGNVPGLVPDHREIGGNGGNDSGGTGSGF